jgi:hypothetical protein
MYFGLKCFPHWGEMASAVLASKRRRFRSNRRASSSSAGITGGGLGRRGNQDMNPTRIRLWNATHHVLTAKEKEGAPGACEPRQFAIREVTR